jgi:hypothetical protein
MKHGKTESELTFGTSQRSSKDLNKASNCSTPLLICKIEETNRKQTYRMLKIMGKTSKDNLRMP